MTEKDFMGRTIVHTKMDAFKQDLPWISACLAMLVFLGFALAGYFRL